MSRLRWNCVQVVGCFSNCCAFLWRRKNKDTWLMLLITKSRYIWHQTDIRVIPWISYDGYCLVSCPVYIVPFNALDTFYLLWPGPELKIDTGIILIDRTGDVNRRKRCQTAVLFCGVFSWYVLAFFDGGKWRSRRCCKTVYTRVLFSRNCRTCTLSRLIDSLYIPPPPPPKKGIVTLDN